MAAMSSGVSWLVVLRMTSAMASPGTSPSAVMPLIRNSFRSPSPNFFSRVGGPYLNELWRDLLDLKDAHPTATTFAKLKKGEKAEKLEKLFADPSTRKAHGLTEAQEARIAAWVPEGME